MLAAPVPHQPGTPPSGWTAARPVRQAIVIISRSSPLGLAERVKVAQQEGSAVIVVVEDASEETMQAVRAAGAWVICSSSSANLTSAIQQAIRLAAGISERVLVER